jgi:primosomal protein N'
MRTLGGSGHRPGPEPVLRAEELKQACATPSCWPAPPCAAGKHRAQLVAKTRHPRRIASQAARLLASAPAMRRARLTAVVDVDPQSL